MIRFNRKSKTDLKAEDVKVDAILLSHGHGDHVGDTVELAKKNNAVVVAPFELATFLSWQGVKHIRCILVVHMNLTSEK